MNWINLLTASLENDFLWEEGGIAKKHGGFLYARYKIFLCKINFFWEDQNMWNDWITYDWHDRMVKFKDKLVF